MNHQDDTSLDRLNDIVLPPDVSWWPLAPGWYVLLAVFSAALVLLIWIFVRKRRANAYRRAARSELANLHDPSSIGELLRRTSLANFPRCEIAELSGNSWARWLESQCREPMPPEVREQISYAAYGRADGAQDFGALRDYAATWIDHHQILSPGNGSDNTTADRQC